MGAVPHHAPRLGKMPHPPGRTYRIECKCEFLSENYVLFTFMPSAEPDIKKILTYLCL